MLQLALGALYALRLVAGEVRKFIHHLRVRDVDTGVAATVLARTDLIVQPRETQQGHDVGILLLDSDVDWPTSLRVGDIVPSLVLQQQVSLGGGTLIGGHVERGATVSIGRVDGGPV
uniref:Putative secreted protein n=1 Tax=Anopheles marajoara TaxID=58244 RepID=A0A2M4C8J2_9DIPT